MPKPAKAEQKETLVQRIHANISGMPDGEKRAATLILDHPGELAVWSATELAELANVSNATVSRLFRRLNYANFEQARREARELRSRGSPLYLDKGKGSASAGSDDPTIQLHNEMQRIQTALTALPVELRDQIANRLASAEKIRLSGFRNSHFLAAYFAASLAQFRPGVARLVPQGQTISEGLSELGEGDVLFVVGFRRRPSVFTKMIISAVSTGACVILLTDPSIRTIPAGVAHTIICPVESQRSLDSYGGALLILRTLALKTAAVLDAKGRRYLERLETLRSSLDELE